MSSAVVTRIGYASRTYQMPEDRAADWLLLASRRSPPSTRRAVLFPIEGGRWFATLTGQGEDLPPHDEDGFRAFARSVDGVDGALDAATPLTRIATYRRTENRWRHWEHRRPWPEGLVLLGDALCCFNPVYGQGMTVAAIQANLLGRLLAASGWGPGSAGRFQRLAARVLRDPWTLATIEDFRFPATTGTRSPATRLSHRYTDEVLRTVVDDAVVTKRSFEVTQLLRPAAALGEPAVLARVLLRKRHGVR